MKAGKAIHTLSLLVAAFALLVITVPVMASETDDRIESAAQDTVESQPGVKSVDNRLEVKGEHPAEKSDAWITAKVKATLFFHQSVSVLTNVDTKDGIVTLKGEADNQAQRGLTTEYAKDIDGVKDVKNEMTVAQTTKKPVGTAVGDKDAFITVAKTRQWDREKSVRTLA